MVASSSPVADISRIVKLGVITETHVDDSGFVSSIFSRGKKRANLTDKF